MLTQQSNRDLPHEHLEFVVGRDSEGHWLAVETHGRGGGIFRNRNTAFHYACDECERRPGAVRLTDEPIQLAFPNSGRSRCFSKDR